MTMPGGMVTSYRPMMWHGAVEEVLHTIVSDTGDGTAKLQGGVSVDFQCIGKDADVWAPREWMLRGVKGRPNQSIQVQRVHSAVVSIN